MELTSIEKNDTPTLNGIRTKFDHALSTELSGTELATAEDLHENHESLNLTADLVTPDKHAKKACRSTESYTHYDGKLPKEPETTVNDTAYDTNDTLHDATADTKECNLDPHEYIATAISPLASAVRKSKSDEK